MRLNGCFGKLFTLVVRKRGKQGQNEGALQHFKISIDLTRGYAYDIRQGTFVELPAIIQGKPRNHLVERQNRLVPKEGFDVLGDIGLIDAEKVLALFQFVLKGEKTWHSPESDKVRHTRAMRLEFIHGGDVHEGRNGGKRGILARKPLSARSTCPLAVLR